MNNRSEDRYMDYVNKLACDNLSLTDHLHMELIDFGMYISPSEKEHKMRINLIKRLKNVFRSLWPKCKVKVFGSMKTQLYLPTSDIDMVIFNATQKTEDNENDTNTNTNKDNKNKNTNKRKGKPKYSKNNNNHNDGFENDPKVELTQTLRNQDMVSYIEIISSARVEFCATV